MTQRDLLLYLRDFHWRDVRVTGHDDAKAPGALPPAPLPAASEVGVAAPADGADPLTQQSLSTMATALVDCRRCRLCQARTQVVFGVGSPEARVMFIGEGPGADEDRLGEPFVGRAGQLLNAMLRAIGMARRDVYIANIVKCRPPKNRDPEPDEAAACMPFLRRQIELIKPEVLVLLGRVAARFLLGTTAPITSYRGRWTKWEGHDVLPVFHPAFLLRNPAAKAQAWADLKTLVRRLDSGRDQEGSRVV